MNEFAHARRPRKATGPARPSCFDGRDVDRVMHVVLALVSEVATLRERLDTHERLAVAGLTATPEHVEAHVATADTESAREAWRDAYIARVLRVLTEDAQLSGAAGSTG
jgi:hypothetical protein